MKNLYTTTCSFFKNDKFAVWLLILLVFLSIFSIYAWKPVVAGDSISYLQAIQVLRTGIAPAGFVPNRIISTSGALGSIIVLNVFTRSSEVSWMLMNGIFYVLMGIFFYLLLLRIVDNPRTAFLSTLFLATNYAAVSFSFHYLMDVSGWAFYVISLYFSFIYLETKESKWLWISAAVIGLGGLFKEYSFVAYFAVFGSVVFNDWREWKKMIGHVFLSGLIAFAPTILVNAYAILFYNYSYLSWLSYAENYYAGQSKLVEYIKSFGSLYNLGWFLFLGGAYYFFKRIKTVFSDKKIFFIWLVILSSLVVFVWPVVTRVLFITMPAAVLVSSLFLEKFDRCWYFFAGLLIPYAVINYLMDAYVLNFVNIQPIINFFTQVHR